MLLYQMTQYSKNVNIPQTGLIYRFNIGSIKIPARVFVGIDKIILKFIQKGKRTKIVKTIMRKKNKME